MPPRVIVGKEEQTEALLWAWKWHWPVFPPAVWRKPFHGPCALQSGVGTQRKRVLRTPPDGVGGGAQGVFPPRAPPQESERHQAHVEPVSPPTHLCDKNKVTHSVLLQKPSIGASTNILRNRLARRTRWLRHNISSAAMTSGTPKGFLWVLPLPRQRLPRPVPPAAGPAAPRLGLAGVTSRSACKIAAPRPPHPLVGGRRHPSSRHRKA